MTKVGYGPDLTVVRSLAPPPGPAFEVLSDAMARAIGPEAGGFVQHVFSLHDADQIRQLVSSARFADVWVEAETLTLRLPAPRDFLWQYVSSTPLAGIVAGAGESSCAELEREVLDGWHQMEEEGALATPQRIVVAGGRRPAES